MTRACQHEEPEARGCPANWTVPQPHPAPAGPPRFPRCGGTARLRRRRVPGPHWRSALLIADIADWRPDLHSCQGGDQQHGNNFSSAWFFVCPETTRSSTWVNQANGSTSFNFAGTIDVATIDQWRPSLSEPREYCRISDIRSRGYLSVSSSGGPGRTGDRAPRAGLDPAVVSLSAILIKAVRNGRRNTPRVTSDFHARFLRHKNRRNSVGCGLVAELQKFRRM
jgi:hypothetical protein